MKKEQIYKHLSEITGIDVEKLELGHEAQLIRPSEVVKLVEKLTEDFNNYNALFSYMYDEHNVKLLDSEIQEIVRIVRGDGNIILV